MSEQLNQLLSTIEKSLENLVTLEIITAVGEIALKPPTGSTPNAGSSFPDLDYEKNPKVIMSKINLLQGDIKTVFNEEFVTGNYQCLRDFHANREKEGSEIIKRNLEALKELCKLVKDFLENRL